MLTLMFDPFWHDTINQTKPLFVVCPFPIYICVGVFYQPFHLVVKQLKSNHGNLRGPPDATLPQEIRPHYSKGLLTIGFPFGMAFHAVAFGQGITSTFQWSHLLPAASQLLERSGEAGGIDLASFKWGKGGFDPPNLGRCFQKWWYPKMDGL